MTDRLHDAERNDLAKRAERAEREAERLRYLYESDTSAIIAMFISIVILACAVTWAGSLYCAAATARDAAQAQSQLYLDGWRQCKREAGERTLQEDYGDGSLLDPVRRIDR